MFCFDQSLLIPALDLAVDSRQRRARGFISHAHFDHLAPHELAFCTPVTARFYRQRLGGNRTVRELPYREPFAWDDYQLTTFPAGHILGAAMLLVETPDQSLLYTGDFRLRPSATAELAEPPRAQWLVMECTFGSPEFRMPPREQVIADLVGVVRQSLAAGLTPVIFAYVLGKAQEVTRILTSAGIPVRQHRMIYELSQLYEQCGCPLGDHSLYDPSIDAEPSAALILPPPGHRWGGPSPPQRSVTIAVTGWGIEPRYKFRMSVDYAFPLSDHADFDELIECVERVQPERVYCWHGQPTFPDELRRRGWDAHWLPETRRMRSL